MTDAASGRGRAALVRDDVEFEAADARLLREVDRTGSVARAASHLGRSRSRALLRIETLEESFGELVDRRRGGSDGGGSRLTDVATDVLARYSRLQAALSATAGVPETVLPGSVESVAGELARVSTSVGTIRGLHDGAETGDGVQARIAADAVTVLAPGADPEPDASSARNRLDGTVTRLDGGETVTTVAVAVGDTEFRALVTAESADRLALREERPVVISWKATATRVVTTGRPRDAAASGTALTDD